jgi:hypothetical protein
MADEPPRWREVNTPEWERRVREGARRDARNLRIFWTVLAVIAVGFFLWMVVDQPGADGPWTGEDPPECLYDDRPWGC